MSAGEPRRVAAVTRLMLQLRLTAVLLALALAASAARAGGIPLRTLDGKDTTLADQVEAGRWTLMMMWTTYCGICRKQYPIVSEFHDRHHGKDASVIGIALDGYDALEAVRAYVAKKPFSFPTVIGDADVVGAAFEHATEQAFTGTPTYLLFDPERKLVATKSGEVTLAVLESAIARARE